MTNVLDLESYHIALYELAKRTCTSYQQNSSLCYQVIFSPFVDYFLFYFHSLQIVLNTRMESYSLDPEIQNSKGYTL